jgi:hypothetical protein
MDVVAPGTYVLSSEHPGQDDEKVSVADTLIPLK